MLWLSVQNGNVACACRCSKTQEGPPREGSFERGSVKAREAAPSAGTPKSAVTIAYTLRLAHAGEVYGLSVATSTPTRDVGGLDPGHDEESMKGA